MKYLATQLVEIGLSNLESQVYIGLLQRKLTTAGALAKHTKLKRSTVYTVLESLIEKGLVSLTQVDSVKHFQAESPDRIGDFLRKRKEELEMKEGLYYKLSDDLNAFYKKNICTPKVSIYEGQNGVNTLLMKNLDDNPQEVLVIGEYVQGEDHIPDYTNRRIKMKIPTKVVIPDSDFGRKTKKLDSESDRLSYLVGEKYKFPASIHIYDKSVAVFTYTGNDPVGIYIENADITESMRMIFDLIEKKVSP
jgi:sugar-specific transcriptional regulator TrmB